MSAHKKKTRGELVRALRELQGLVGQIASTYGNDRAPDRADKMEVLCTRAFNVAVDALATDPPQRTNLATTKAGDGEQGGST